jgi:anti-anti-sigma regulatory factor
MATQITQIDLSDERRTVLRIEGDMLHDDAVLVEKIAASINEQNGNRITIDLADLDYLDSEAASVLRRMGDLDHFEITGTEIFLQSAVDLAERA